jgi:D-alanyl-D-alanine carboxypeptidase
VSRRAARRLRDERLAALVAQETMPIATIVRVSPLAPPPVVADDIDGGLLDPRPARAQHARRRPAPAIARVGVVASLAVAGVLVAGSAVVTAAVSETDAPVAALAASAPERYVAPIPGPADMPVTPPMPVDLCADPAVQAALAARVPAEVILAAGGAAVLREEIAAGRASCVPLGDPAYPWVVINKTRPLDPLDHRPDDLLAPEGVRNLGGGWLRADAASALTSMVAAAAASGVGEIALESSFRSYQTQQQTYGAHASARGVEGADAVSARPGFSEHQSGLAVDVVACGGGGCGSLDGIAATPQGAWVAENAWQYGFIVRYEEGRTDVTGYIPEPWHLRYIGRELAAEYHAGGFLSLEEFFGLPPAPDYIG